MKRTLEQLQVSRASFYRWYKAYVEYGSGGLAPHPSRRRQFWNRVPDPERQQVVDVALQKPELSLRQLAWHITDRQGWYISESSVYRILKAYDLVSSPHFIVLKAHERFPQPPRRVHELWQTDFTYLKVTSWGWYYLGSVLDDYSRYVIDWRLFKSMSAEDVKELLEAAVAKTGVDRISVRHRPRVKELKQEMELGRLSCHGFWANQLRLLLSAAVFVVMQALRMRLRKLGWATAQVGTLRLRLLKIGGRVTRSVRRYVVHLAATHPWAREWQRAARMWGAISP